MDDYKVTDTPNQETMRKRLNSIVVDIAFGAFDREHSLKFVDALEALIAEQVRLARIEELYAMKDSLMSFEVSDLIDGRIATLKQPKEQS